MGDAQPVPHLSNQTQALAASVFVVAVDFSAKYFPGAGPKPSCLGLQSPPLRLRSDQAPFAHFAKRVGTADEDIEKFGFDLGGQQG